MAGNPLADNVNLLRQGLLDLQQSVQGLQFQRVLANANEQVRNIRAAEGKEEEKRQALHQIANDLTFQMAGMGVPATTMQQIGGAIDPDRGFREKMALMLARQQSAQQPAPEPKKEDVNFATNINVANKLIDELGTTIQKVGTFESRLGDKAASAKLKAIPYQLAITYAKIVDPESVAREGEVQAAQKYMIDTGLFADNETAMEQLKHMKKTIKEYAAQRGQIKGRSFAQPAAATKPADLGVPGLTLIQD